MTAPSFCPVGQTFIQNSLESSPGFLHNNSDITFPGNGLKWERGAHGGNAFWNTADLAPGLDITGADFAIGFTLVTLDGTDTFIELDDADVETQFFQAFYNGANIQFNLVGVGTLYTLVGAAFPLNVELRFTYLGGGLYKTDLYLNSVLVATNPSSLLNIAGPTGVRFGGARDGGTVHNFYAVGAGLPNNCPAAVLVPVPFMPAVADGGVSLSPILEVTDPNDPVADDYDFQISTDGTFAGPDIVYSVAGAENDHLVPLGNLDGLTKYFWRARARIGVDFSDWSSDDFPTYFTTGAAVPSSGGNDMEIIVIESKGLPRLQKDVVVDDDPTLQNALFPSSKTPNDNERKEAANAIMVSTSGNVKVRLVNGVDANGKPARNVDDSIPVVAGVWHACSPFDHVYETGTDPSQVKVGVTSWRYNLGS